MQTLAGLPNLVQNETKRIYMRHRLPLAFLALLFLGHAYTTAAQTDKLTGLDWLAGCWRSPPGGKDMLINEQWMRPAGGMMIGMGRTVVKGRAVDFEFMRIEQRGDDVFFIAKPKANAAETPFKLTTSSPTEAIFENPDHDFPQRVIYRLTKAGGLAARIEGTVKGKAKGIDFPMDRAKCG